MELAYPKYAPIFSALPYPYSISLYSPPLAFFAVTSKLAVSTYQQFYVFRGVDRLTPSETRIALGQNIIAGVIGLALNQQSYLLGVNLIEGITAIIENEYA